MTIYRDADHGCAVMFLIVWAGIALGVIAFWCVVVWAIIKLVLHFTGGAA